MAKVPEVGMNQIPLGTLPLQAVSSRPSFRFSLESDYSSNELSSQPYLGCSSDGRRQTLEPLQDVEHPPLLREGPALLLLQQQRHQDITVAKPGQMAGIKRSFIWWAWQY